MKRMLQFWTILIVSILVILFATCNGCDNKPPDGGAPVARRHFSGALRLGSVKTDFAREDNINSRPDGGYGGHPQFALWARPSYSDEAPCDIGGVKLDVITEQIWDNYIYYPIEAIHLTTPFFTNDTGYGVFYAGMNTGNLGDGYSRSFSLEVYMNRAANNIAGIFSYKGPAGYYEWLPVGNPDPIRKGEYWGCASQIGYGHLALNEVGEISIRPALASVPMSDKETAFLNSEPNHFDDYLVSVKSQTWCRVKRVGDEYRPVEAKYLYPITNNKDVILNNSTPYYISYCFYTTEPVVLQGMTFSAGLKYSKADPNEANKSYADIDIKVIADNGDKRSHVARTGFIVPVDPNGFEPYHLKSETGVYFLVAPMDEDGYLTVEFKDMNQFLPFISEYWLTDCKALDLFRDGIINLKDWSLYQ